jgi:hypothetical protein
LFKISRLITTPNPGTNVFPAGTCAGEVFCVLPVEDVVGAFTVGDGGASAFGVSAFGASAFGASGGGASAGGGASGGGGSGGASAKGSGGGGGGAGGKLNGLAGFTGLLMFVGFV